MFITKKKHKDTTAFGTEYYASPEQYGFRQTDFRSDLYSLGKVLSVIYEHMQENKKIKDLINGLTNIDFTKRYDYNKINSYFNKTYIPSTNFKQNNVEFFLPYFHFTNKHALNVLLNAFSWFFLFS